MSRAPATLVELKAGFVDFIRHNRNLSPNTVRAYDTDLEQFVESLAFRDSVKPPSVDVTTV